MFNIDGDKCHDSVICRIKPKLSFYKNKDFNEQKRLLKEKFIQLIGIQSVIDNDAPMEFEILLEEQKDGYKLVRMLYMSEKDAVIPCALLIPDGVEKAPVCITLQGNTPGFRISIGETGGYDYSKYPPCNPDELDYAIQAVKNGYCAFAIELRGCGSLYSNVAKRAWIGSSISGAPAVCALALGRTLMAERLFDIKKGLDYLDKYFPVCDTSKSIVLGNDIGGVTAYYASIYDERIKICVNSCGFSSYKHSLLDNSHSFCEYIPNAYLYFDMQDLALTFAPKKLIVLGDDNDEFITKEGFDVACDTVKTIYSVLGFKDNFVFGKKSPLIGWDKKFVWDNVNQTVKTLGWR